MRRRRGDGREKENGIYAKHRADLYADFRAVACADGCAENGSDAEMNCRNRAEFGTTYLCRKNGSDADAFAEGMQYLVQ